MPAAMMTRESRSSLPSALGFRRAFASICFVLYNVDGTTMDSNVRLNMSLCLRDQGCRMMSSPERSDSQI